MREFAIILTALTLVLPSCRPSPPQSETAAVNDADIRVTMDWKAYDLGDVARVTIQNETDTAILFAIVCDALVEGRERDVWRTVFAPDCSKVKVTPTRLASGESVTTNFEIQCDDAATLPAYYTFRLRIRFQLDGGSGYREAYSSWFVIDEP